MAAQYWLNTYILMVKKEYFLSQNFSGQSGVYTEVTRASCVCTSQARLDGAFFKTFSAKTKYLLNGLGYLGLINK